MTGVRGACTIDVMALMSPDHEWTVDDIDRLPDDGLRYELLDGMLLVTPAPVPVHQRVVTKLGALLAAACPADQEAFVAPLDWRPDRSSSLQPDVLVARVADIGPANITAPLVLAVEVLSPSTRRKDLVLKRSKYEDEGVEHYWIVDPVEPSIEALQWRNGRYVVVGRVSGTDVLTLDQPFPVSICPALLVRR